LINLKFGIDFLSLQYYIYCSNKKKGGIDVSPRTGRPKSDNSKDTMLRVRIDEETVNKLDFTSRKLDMTKSEVVRNGIENEYQKALKK